MRTLFRAFEAEGNSAEIFGIHGGLVRCIGSIPHAHLRALSGHVASAALAHGPISPLKWNVLMSKTVLLAILFVLAVVGTLVYSSMELRQFTCEVCIEYKGRSNCSVASGTTKEEAVRTATDTACATISGGMTESIQCGNTAPVSVTWQE